MRFGRFQTLGSLLVLIGMLFCSASARSEGYFSEDDPGAGPLRGRNQQPLLTHFYTPGADRAASLPKGKVETGIQFDLTNTIYREQNGPNSATYDLEIRRTAFTLAYGLLDNLDLQLEIPFLNFDDGFLDGFLTGYHDVFNLPDSGRSRFPEDSFSYRVRYQGRTVVQYAPLGFTIADMSLGAKWVLLKQDGIIPAIAFRSAIKFPTGDFADGSGSGNWDYSVGLVFSHAFHRLHLFGGADGILIDVPFEMRPLIQRDYIVHYYWGGEFVLWKKYLSFLLQFDGQTTPFAPTGLDVFDRPVLEVIPGFRGRLWDERLSWQAALHEDVVQGSTVDFTASFNLSATF